MIIKDDIVIGARTPLLAYPNIKIGAQSKAHKQNPGLADTFKSIPIEQSSNIEKQDNINYAL